MANRFTGSIYSFTSNAMTEPHRGDSNPVMLPGRLIGFAVILGQNEITK